MDTNSFKNALSELDALKAKALSVQQEIDARKQDSLDLSDTLGQKEVDNTTKYAEQAALAKITSLNSVDSTSEKRSQKFISDWAAAFSSASSSAKGFGDTTSGVLQNLASNLLNSATGSSSTGTLVSSVLSSVLGSGVFGGFFADGGRPDPTKVSVVGEQGPELFVPDAAGTVVPNDALGKSQSVVVYQNFTFQSLDPATNMKLLQAQKEQIQSWVADGIKTNQNGLRSAVKSA